MIDEGQAHDLKDSKFQMRVDDSFARKLEDLRKSERDLPTRAEMLRRLVDRAHTGAPIKSQRS